MKNIGHTNQGNFLVEMSEIEYANLAYLSAAVRGKTFHSTVFSDLRHMDMDNDFAKAFLAIKVFTDALFKVNEFQYIVDELKEMLQVEHKDIESDKENK